MNKKKEALHHHLHHPKTLAQENPAHHRVAPVIMILLDLIPEIVVSEIPVLVLPPIHLQDAEVGPPIEDDGEEVLIGEEEKGALALTEEDPDLDLGIAIVVEEEMAVGEGEVPHRSDGEDDLALNHYHRRISQNKNEIRDPFFACNWLLD